MSELLPGSEEVAFVDLPAAAEAAIATVVVVAPPERLREAADALKPSARSGGVRLILISAGTSPPGVRAGADGILLEGLKREHFDNAVASLRFSSLPTLVWWRGGSPDVLPGLAALADRLVLDAADPREVWGMVPQLAEHTAVTDVRWARLTRWRALLAHLFDIPGVRAASGTFRSLRIRGADVHAARLFAGWLVSSLGAEGMEVEVEEVTGAPAGAPPIQHVRVGSGRDTLTLRLAGSGTCVCSSVERDGGPHAAQTVSLGDQGLAAVIAEELRIRSRDVTFERSIRAIERPDDPA